MPVAGQPPVGVTMILLRLLFFISIPAALAVGRDGKPGAGPGWISLFDGKAPDHWVVQGGTAPFHVEDGQIVGTTAMGPSRNTFLCTTRDYADFEFQFEVFCDPELNSGVQIRSHVYAKDTPQASPPDRIREKGEVYGYQCEVAANGSCTSGNFWDEGRWNKWHDDLSMKPGACAAFRTGAWNHFRIVAQGDRIRSWVNGIPCADFQDTLDATGFIGLQVHRMRTESGQSFRVRWRNLRLRELKPTDIVN